MVTATAEAAPAVAWRSRVWPAALFQASFVGGVAFFKSGATAMLVARLSADVLPPIYILAAVLTALLAPLQGWLIKKSTPPRATMLVAILLSLGLGVLSSTGSTAAVIALYLLAEIYSTLMSLRFWAAVGETFDAREGKRVFAIVSGAGMAGCIVGGFIAKVTGEQIGAAGFLVATAITMLACRLFAGRMVAVGGKSLTRPAESPLRAFKTLTGDRYARGIAYLALVLSALTVGVDFVFRVRAGKSLTENQLAALFGEVNLWVGVCATAFQFSFAGRLLSRFGIFRYLLIVPATCVGLTVAAFVSPTLWPAFALKIVETVGSLSVNPTGLQLLYAGLPDTTRPMARSAIDGLVKKGGIAIGGALLLLFGAHASESITLGLVGVAALGIVVSIVRLRRLYVEALDARLTRARWHNDIHMDASARTVLTSALEAPDAARVLTAMSLLATRSPETLRARLRNLLAHPEERVRERAVKLSVELNATEVVPTLREMTGEAERRPRYEAVRALASLDPDDTAFLWKLTASDDAGLRSAAIGALVKVELSAGKRGGDAQRLLDRLLGEGENASIAERREMAHLLGHIADTGILRSLYASHLETYLHDPDASVRRIAAGAAAKTRLLNLVPILVDMLGRPGERRAAREALQSYGEEVVPVLASALNDKRLPARVRYEVPRMLRYLGSARAAEVLLFSNIQDDPMLRHRIAFALSRMRRQNAELPLDRERVQQAIGRRVDAYLYYKGVAHDLTPALPANAILMRALTGRLEQNLEIIFRLLGLIVPHDPVMRAYQHLRSATTRERAVALELLENLVDQDLRERLWPVLESPEAPPAPQEPTLLVARLGELAASKDHVLAAIAIYTARVVLPGAVAFSIPEEELVSENVIEKVFLIEGVDMFASSEVDDLMALAAIAQERHFEKGDVIYTTGDAGDSTYIIIDGAVRIDKDGREIMTLGATESFGETSLLDGAPRPATAIAARHTRVLWIERHDFLDLVSDRPELLKGVFSAVTRNLRRVLEVAAAGKLSPSKEQAAALTPEKV